ncbi:MAG TPA: hypothetical protein VKN99_09085 [Polyangia bacterium]|nr:hypothetical protein [Polyangia bacterium]
MPTYKGTVRKSEFGGGWELHTEGGEVFELDGNGPFAEGARVEVSGKVDEDSMSISMRGPILKVRAAKRL